jgi:hypothetical protein
MDPIVTTLRGFSLLSLFILFSGVVGCWRPSDTGLVTGRVTVDGLEPAEGASITFFPEDGKSTTAGDLIENGIYEVEAPVGVSKVQIRVPRPALRPNQSIPKDGPGSQGPGAGGYIEESLPAKYHDQSILTVEVKPGKSIKDWELSTK